MDGVFGGGVVDVGGEDGVGGEKGCLVVGVIIHGLRDERVLELVGDVFGSDRGLLAVYFLNHFLFLVIFYKILFRSPRSFLSLSKLINLYTKIR